jgi:MOSC domain-containing protein YiiM
MSPAHGTIVSLQISAAPKAPMQLLRTVRAIADLGLEGDSHAKAGSARQVLLMDEETLAVFQLSAARIRENITTRGIDLKSLAAGARLRAGTAIFEITKPCSPCEFINAIRSGLRTEMEGQRGMLARVVHGGEIQVGDTIEVAG